MARPNKHGIDYFPFDVDFFQDEKVQFVSARFGTKGESITVRLLCRIYRNGYYTEWSEDAALLFAKGVGDNCQHSCVIDVVSELLKRGFFDRSIFERFSVLTSRGIQKRYLTAVAGRKDVEIDMNYWLLDEPVNDKKTTFKVSSETTGVSTGINSLNIGRNATKETKVNKSIPLPANAVSGRAREAHAPDPLSERGFSEPLEAKIREWLQYKAERNEAYKPTGLKSMLTEIQNNAAKYGESAVIELIGMCMANGWKGIIWDKLAQKKPGIPGQKGSSLDLDDYEKKALLKFHEGVS